MRKIFIAGDSTAANKRLDARPESGWGEYLEHFLPNVKVLNFAANGKSSKSFIKEGLLDQIDILIEKDDILLIQFGHNDAKKEDPTRYTSPNITYHKYLMNYVMCAKKHGAIPIFLSSITRRNFINETIDPNANQAYPKNMKRLSITQDIIFIDMFSKSQEFIQNQGVLKSKELYLHLLPHTHTNYPNGIEDNTHFTPYGAKLFAKMIADEIKDYVI